MSKSIIALFDMIVVIHKIAHDRNQTVRTDTEKLRIINRLITDWTAGKYKDCLNEDLEN